MIYDRLARIASSKAYLWRYEKGSLSSSEKGEKLSIGSQPHGYLDYTLNECIYETPGISAVYKNAWYFYAPPCYIDS